MYQQGNHVHAQKYSRYRPQCDVLEMVVMDRISAEGELLSLSSPLPPIRPQTIGPINNRATKSEAKERMTELSLTDADVHPEGPMTTKRETRPKGLTDVGGCLRTRFRTLPPPRSVLKPPRD